MNYLNQSGISQQAIRENLDNNIIEELLSGLISTTLIDLEVEDFNLSITELTVLKKIKENKNFQDENNVFQRTKYEKFLLSNNMSAPMFELQLKNRELQKHLFDFIGAGTITPDFLIKKKFEEENKSLELEYFAMENFYKDKESFTDQEINKFLDENKDQLKREYIDFKYAELNPKILIGLDEFNQDFFDEIDKIENRISNGEDFQSIIQNIKVDITEIKEFTPSSTKKINEDLIYSKRSSEVDLIENGDNFLLYSITNKFDRGPDLTDQDTKEEIRELVYQKGKFDLNRSVLEEIQNKKFNDNKFKEMAGYSKEYLTINSIKDNDRFEANSVKILYSLPLNSYTLVNDKENKIYLVKLINSKKNTFSETDENYLNFVNNQNTNTRKTILQSYDQLLNSKYQVQLNQKTIDRVKNYFK
jgi:peptidyl-prolyl cis-trans isomerase D